MRLWYHRPSPMNPDQLIEAQAMVEALLGTRQLPTSPEHECAYLPGLTARVEGFQVDRIDPELYHALMDRGFRRSGCLVFRPVCPACRECVPLRVPVEVFRPTRSQRRVLRRNRDLRVTVGAPKLTDRKHRMYAAYLDDQHDGTMSRSRRALSDFLYDSPVNTLEFCYRLKNRLVAVSIADRSRAALSSVYVFFDPRFRRRSLGTFSALWEIDFCRRAGTAFYYLGYYVAGSARMNYKARFRPCEILDPSRGWVPPAPPEVP